jgi:TatD DNase family protein
VIDFHCHIDLYPDPSAVIDRVIRDGIYVLAVTTTPRAWQGTRALTARATRIRVGLGLHPELVAERHQEVDLLCSMVTAARYIGEIGLDGSPPHKSALKRQQQVLARILDTCSQHGGRIMTLHSRGATSLVLDALEAHPAAGNPVLHWFSGNRHELERAIHLGCWFSVGPAMLRTRKGVALVEAMPQARVLTETDGPFAKRHDKPLMPWEVDEAVKQLAQLWKHSVSTTSNIIEYNFRILLNAGATYTPTNSPPCPIPPRSREW